MKDERFNELCNGPLYHPSIHLSVARLLLALRAVVQATGKAGDDALEEHCRQREAQDRINSTI